MANLGTARGAIEIGTESLNKIVGFTRQVGQQVKQNFGLIDAAAKSTELRLAGISKNIGKVRGELTGLSIGAGALTGLGLATAGGIEEAKIQMQGLTGSQAKATALMEDLRKKARATGQPFKDVLSFAQQMLPTLEGNTAELQKWFDVTRRLATQNTGPNGGMSGATFAIREAFLAAQAGGTDFVSLVERFNISKKLLNDALATTNGDFIAAMDIVLNKMGVTTETADQMGKTFNASFRVAKDAALQALGAGFTPLMETLTPILQATADWFTQLQQGNPEILKWGAGIATVATVGAPTLLLLNNLIDAYLKLKNLGALGAVGRPAAVAIGLGVGAAAGTYVANAIGRSTGNEHAANATVESSFKELRELIFGAAVRINQLNTQASNWLSDITIKFVNKVADMISAIGAFNAAVGRILPGWAGGDKATENASIYAGMADALRKRADDMAVTQGQNNAQRQASLYSFREFIMPDWDRGGLPDTSAADDAAAKRAELEQQTNDKILAAKLSWAAAVQQIESQANAARLAATAQYEQQRSQTIAQYEKSIARDAEDYAISRRRAAQQLADQIADVASEAARREAEWTQDLNEQIARARADGNKRIAELEADYQKSRERAAQQHNDTLFEAAGRLDAKAILAEQRRYDRESKNAAEDHDERIQKEKESLQESIDQNQAAHAERLAESRQADERRIADLRESLAESKRLEDEDRALRLARQAEDHADQLAAMDAAHAAQLAAINAQAAAERELLDQQTAKELAALQVKNDAWLKIQDEQQKASLRLFDKFWEAWNKRFELYGPGRDPNAKFFSGFTNENPYGPAPDPNAPPKVDWFTSFGKSATTDPAVIRAAMAGGLVAPGSAGGGGGVRGFGAGNVTIGQGAITIYGAPGQSEEKIGAVVEQRLIDLFGRMAPQ